MIHSHGIVAEFRVNLKIEMLEPAATGGEPPKRRSSKPACLRRGSG